MLNLYICKNVSETSVMMFDYMLKSNEGLMDSFEEYLETKDIEFVKELMKEKNEVCQFFVVLVFKFMHEYCHHDHDHHYYYYRNSSMKKNFYMR